MNNHKLDELLERIRRIESMMVFMFEKQRIELSRRPEDGEVIKGKESRVVYVKTWLEEWEPRYNEQERKRGGQQ